MSHGKEKFFKTILKCKFNILYFELLISQQISEKLSVVDTFGCDMVAGVCRHLLLNNFPVHQIQVMCNKLERIKQMSSVSMKYASRFYNLLIRFNFSAIIRMYFVLLISVFNVKGRNHSKRSSSSTLRMTTSTLPHQDVSQFWIWSPWAAKTSRRTLFAAYLKLLQNHGQFSMYMFNSLKFALSRTQLINVNILFCGLEMV